jgi:hypothetical protein
VDLSEEEIQASTANDAHFALRDWSKSMFKTLKAAFKGADADGSGFLSLEEMKNAVTMAGVTLEQEELSMLMTMYDESNDGKVSFEEFGKAMIKQRNANPLAHQHIVPGTEVKLDGRIIPQKAPSKPALPVPKPKPGLHD